MPPFVNLFTGLCLLSAILLLANGSSIPITRKVRQGKFKDVKQRNLDRANVLNLRARGEATADTATIQDDLITLAIDVKIGGSTRQ